MSSAGILRTLLNRPQYRSLSAENLVKGARTRLNPSGGHQTADGVFKRTDLLS